MTEKEKRKELKDRRKQEKKLRGAGNVEEMGDLIGLKHKAKVSYTLLKHKAKVSCFVLKHKAKVNGFLLKHKAKVSMTLLKHYVKVSGPLLKHKAKVSSTFLKSYDKFSCPLLKHVCMFLCLLHSQFLTEYSLFRLSIGYIFPLSSPATNNKEYVYLYLI